MDAATDKRARVSERGGGESPLGKDERDQYSKNSTKDEASSMVVQATLRRFRDTATRIRAQVKQHASPKQAAVEWMDGQQQKVALPHGLAVLKGALSFREQLELAKQSLDEFAFFPHNNLSVLGTELPRDAHLKKVRWACLGMNYDWTNRKYVEGWRSEFPESLAKLCTSLAAKGGFAEDYVPEAAIVNFYTPSQIMGPHRDDAELTMGKPIISISLGCDAIFCIETKPFQEDSEVLPLLLRSGDVVVMGGDSRQALHGVAVTIPHSFEVPSADELGSPLTPEDKRIIKVLNQQRININVRQVEDQCVEAFTFKGRAKASLPHVGAMSCSAAAASCE